MTKESFTTLFWQNFTSIKHGAEFFHVKPVTVRRWLDGRNWWLDMVTSKRLRLQSCNLHHIRFVVGAEMQLLGYRLSLGVNK
ncbi:TPA: hypothetical protein ACVU5U_004481 [Vibrio parahaemolyticus]